MLVIVLSIILLFCVLENDRFTKLKGLKLIVGFYIAIISVHLVFDINIPFPIIYDDAFSSLNIIPAFSGVIALMFVLSISLQNHMLNVIDEYLFKKLTIIAMSACVGLATNSLFFLLLILLLMELYLAFSFRQSFLVFCCLLVVVSLYTLFSKNLAPTWCSYSIVLVCLLSVSRLSRSTAQIIFPVYLFIIKPLAGSSFLMFNNNYINVGIFIAYLLLFISANRSKAFGLFAFISILLVAKVGLNSGLVFAIISTSFLNYTEFSNISKKQAFENFILAVPVLTYGLIYFLMPYPSMFLEYIGKLDFVRPFEHSSSFVFIFVTYCFLNTLRIIIQTFATTRINVNDIKAGTPLLLLSASMTVVLFKLVGQKAIDFDGKDLLISVLLVIVIGTIAFLLSSREFFGWFDLHNRLEYVILKKATLKNSLTRVAAHFEKLLSLLCLMAIKLFDALSSGGKNTVYLLADTAEYVEPKKFQHEAFWLILIILSFWYYIWGVVG